MALSLAFALLFVGCGFGGALRGPDEDSADRGESGGALDSSGGDSDLGDSDPTDSAIEDTGSDGPCPPGMVHLGEALCIDAFEATLEVEVGGVWSAFSPYQALNGERVRASVGSDRVPQGYLSGEEAAEACVNAGKRLCTSEEWLSACRGAGGRAFPYGSVREEGACNDAYDGHPVVDYFGTATGVWDSAHMNNPGINQQPGTVARGGAFARCRTPEGVYDLHGNLHEWVSDAEGTFRGGFYADASINGVGCGYATTAHDRAWHDYSTGFRCCADAEG